MEPCIRDILMANGINRPPGGREGVPAEASQSTRQVVRPDRWPDWDWNTHPYRAGHGQVPEAFVGREPELRLFRGLVGAMRAGPDRPVGAPPHPVVIMAPRGNGKTALMERVRRDLLTDPEISVLDIAAPEMGDTVAGALEALLVAAGRETVSGTTAATDKGGLRAVLRFDKEVRPAGRHLPGNFRSILAEAVGGGPLVLMIDEAHRLDPGIGGLLLNTGQALCRRNLPFLLVLAGTPDLHDNLRGMDAAFFARLGRGDMRPGLLEPDQLRGAVLDPLLKRGATVADDTGDALGRMIAMCSGYPYFAEMCGVALWEGLKDRSRSRDRPARPVIDRELVGQATVHLERGRQAHYLSLAGEFGGATRSATYVLARILGAQPYLSRMDLDLAIESGLRAYRTARGVQVGPEEIEGRVATECTRILHSGFVWQPDGARDRFAPGIPSFISFVGQAFEESRDPRIRPVIAEADRLFDEGIYPHPGYRKADGDVGEPEGGDAATP